MSKKKNKVNATLSGELKSEVMESKQSKNDINGYKAKELQGSRINIQQ
ncbi:hypothetical protein SAMN02745196_00706 [Clostridium collagenovorans DSM 3089]|uniref:Uncharacterized protein n=1 Tax=Clostridium collagenovorans DSM 3089 TaxID=1121306 RepID=A0A1M5TT97_9CLOT|nr:hypothetical protein [Clostridium collagenovorans]SHH53898.1 hypothetical protein SAMN02745196_00706 [Clostridium collagenovorans DSM 3089]